MDSKQWDPLLSGRDTDTEVVSAAQKREIRNILKSYVGMYDSFSELIQNAMDAVDRRAVIEKSNQYTKKLWLIVNLQESSFSITDNGIGFNEKEFKAFLAPNISFKGGGNTRGNKGVGATYIAYGFNYLQFGTKGNGYEFVGEILNGIKWVEDSQGVVTRPVVTPSKCSNDAFLSITRGSTFTLKFGSGTRPKDLSWYMATTAEQWLYLLLIKTPLGAIKYINDQKDDIKFKITVIDREGNITEQDDNIANYIYPHLKIRASVNLKEILDVQRRMHELGKDSSDIPSKYLKSYGIYEFFNTDDLLLLRVKDEDFSSIVSQYNIEAYGYFAYSTVVWDQFNDSIAKLRKSYRVLKGGLQLSNNNMIQGELIAIPLTSNIGYQNQCHIIVHFKNADPDLGRKGFQPELKDTAEKISVAIVNRFKNWRRLLKTDSGTQPNDIARELELHEWIRAQEVHEKNNPLILKNKNFFAPINEISIVSEPQSEQDVIVLFNQLVAGGVIRGINLLATSQIKQYDGVYKYVVKSPLSNHVFDKLNNPLGVEELHFNKEYTSPPKVLEYKYNLDALIHEFENEYKNEKDIHLAVTWEMGNEWKKNYEAISYLQLDNLHQRSFHGLTHRLCSKTSKFDVIVLKELIEYLNDVDGVQEHHRKQYHDDL